MKRILCLLVAGFLTWFTLHGEEAKATLPFTLLNEEVPTLAPMLKKALPSVVNISTSGKAKMATNPLLNDPFFRRFFEEFGGVELPNSQEQQQPTQSIGSGVIVDAAKGYVLTNHHVVSDADKIYVILQDKRKLEAKLVGSDKETDVALLQVKGDHLTTIPLGDSDALQVGDFAVAIGNPFGLGHTVTSGIISALGRSGLGIEGYEDFIQTDASINPGNSGGALINLKGELVGINTAILSGNGGGNVGIGFSIPINMIKGVMQQLITHGEIKRGQIGVHIQDITPELKEAMHLKTESGALVAKVVEGGPADKAGIKTGDVITSVNGKPVQGSSALRNMVGLRELGEKIEISFIRGEETKTVTVEISKAENKEEVAMKPGDSKAGSELLQGAAFAPIPSGHPLYKQVQGVMASEVALGSLAWQAGLRENDVIVSVNNRKVTTVKELIVAVKLNPKSILMNIRRGDSALFIVVR